MLFPATLMHATNVGVCKNSEEYGLSQNMVKMKCLYVDAPNNKMQMAITINGQAVEAVEEFNYVGLYIANQGDCAKEIRR